MASWPTTAFGPPAFSDFGRVRARSGQGRRRRRCARGCAAGFARTASGRPSARFGAAHASTGFARSRRIALRADSPEGHDYDEDSDDDAHGIDDADAYDDDDAASTGRRGTDSGADLGFCFTDSDG